MRDRLLMRRRVGDRSVHPPRRHSMQQLETTVLRAPAFYSVRTRCEACALLPAARLPVPDCPTC